jgi:V-type H+-transporting ATPase subunit H
MYGATGAVKGLVEVVKSAQKEKVVRVGLLALKNMMDQPDLDVAADMVDAGLPKVLLTRSMQVWGEEGRVRLGAVVAWEGGGGG